MERREAMIINSIKEARAAMDVLQDTRRTIQNAGGLRSSTRFGLGIQRSGYTDPVAEVALLRERLQKKLAAQEQYALFCYTRMMEELQKIPGAVTQQIFLCRYYCGCTWSVVAQQVGLGVQAAKMRHQRYLKTEEEQHVA